MINTAKYIKAEALFASLKGDLGFSDEVTYVAEANDEMVRLRLTYPEFPGSQITVYVIVYELEEVHGASFPKVEYGVNWRHTCGDFLCQVVTESYSRLCHDIGYATAYAERKAQQS